MEVNPAKTTIRISSAESGSYQIGYTYVTTGGSSGVQLRGAATYAANYYIYRIEGKK